MDGVPREEHLQPWGHPARQRAGRTRGPELTAGKGGDLRGVRVAGEVGRGMTI